MKFFRKLRHLLIPHESNNHKAKILHNSSLTIIIFGFLVLHSVFTYLPNFGPKILGFAANISPDEVIRLTNEKRVTNGLSTLTTNATLSQAAQAKGADMLNKDYWAHVAPDGTQPWYFFTSFGYQYRFAGENLARDFSDPTSAVDAWMASPSHKENLLSTKYKEIGVAVVEGDLAGVDTTIIVQFFGTNLVDTTPETPIAEAKAASTSPTPTRSGKLAVAPIIAQISPIPTPTPSVNPALISAPSSAASSKVLISPFGTTRGISLVTIILLGTIMIIDIVLSYRRRIVRIGGRTIAHIAFLGMIMAIILIARAGRVL